MTKRTCVGIVVILGLLAAMSGRLMSQNRVPQRHVAEPVRVVAEPARIAESASPQQQFENAPSSLSGKLHEVSSLLATKADRSPSDEQLAAAIDNYLLSIRVEAAITLLKKIVEDSPQSIQARRAKAAIDVLTEHAEVKAP